MNVTVVPQGGLGFLTAWPTGEVRPFVSTLNSWDGTVLANAAIVPAGTDGAVSFYASDTTDLVVDINGFFAVPGPGRLNFHTVSPCRFVDTRGANGPLGGPIIPGEWVEELPAADRVLRPAVHRAGLLSEHDGRASGASGLLDNVAHRSTAAVRLDAE